MEISFADRPDLMAFKFLSLFRKISEFFSPVPGPRKKAVFALQPNPLQFEPHSISAECLHQSFTLPSRWKSDLGSGLFAS